jgi:hypothetical protein
MVRENVHYLAHPALAEAATAHADFLDGLAATHELSHQQVVVVVTATGTARRAGVALRRTAQDVADRLATLGIRTHVLDGEAAEQVLRQAMTAPGMSLTDPESDDDNRSDTDSTDDHQHEEEGR